MLAGLAGIRHGAPGSACDQMGSGLEAVVYLYFAAYLAYATVVLIASVTSAVVRARRREANRGTVWIQHCIAAALFIVGPPLAWYAYENVSAAASRREFRRDSARVDPWIAKLRFEPGQVSHALDEAIAAMPNARHFSPVNMLEAKAYAALEAPGITWTPEDLSAFSNLVPRLEGTGNPNPMAVLVAWRRQPENLSAALAGCNAMAYTDGEFCRSALRSTVIGWCADKLARCDDFVQQPDFRDAAVTLSVAHHVAPAVTAQPPGRYPDANAFGSISPATPQVVVQGSTARFTVTRAAGYVAGMGGTCRGTLVGTTYTTNAITADCTVNTDFTLTSYEVTPSAGPNGTIRPTRLPGIPYGATATFEVTPNEGYSATVGGTCGGTLVGHTYTTRAITADCTVSAAFR